MMGRRILEEGTPESTLLIMKHEDNETRDETATGVGKTQNTIEA
jgi:hypothetical protein